MTGPEHYALAEKLLAGTRKKDPWGDWRSELSAPEAVARAQVHATLALAAATATPVRMSGPAAEAWDTATGATR